MGDESKKYGAEGGKARAAKLSKEQRSEIAKKAAAARWGEDLPVAAHAGLLKIGELEFPCAVLSDGETRILTQSDFMAGMGMYYSGWVAKNRPAEDAAAGVPHFLAFKNLRPFVDKHLGDLQSIIVKYKTEKGTIAHGIKAEIIPKICDVWIDADDAGVLKSRQKLIAAKARLLMRALAHTGIVALVDEATGFQNLRAQDALARYLEQYVAKELRQWVRTFPRSFFEELCRLKGQQLPDDMRLPKYYGRYINDLVYDRLAPGLRRELQEKNPAGPNGRRKAKHHQWLTEDVGNPRLLHHLGLLEGIGKAFDDGDWDGYRAAVNKRLPKPNSSLPLFSEQDDEEDA